MTFCNNELYHLTCALALQSILKHYASLTRYDLEILRLIHASRFPLSFMVIDRAMPTQRDRSVLNRAIKGLIENGYLTRKPLHKYVQYHITQDGIRLLHDVNIALEQAVYRKDT